MYSQTLHTFYIRKPGVCYNKFTQGYFEVDILIYDIVILFA